MNFKDTQRLPANRSQKMQPAEKQLIYLYCVTAMPPVLKEVTRLVRNLYFVYHVDLFAIVGKVAESEFGQESLKANMADLEWVKTKISLHEKVIEGTMNNACTTLRSSDASSLRSTSVVPFKFATLFSTEESLKAMLTEYAEEFKTILKKLKNKEEWGVKIYCDTGRLEQSLVNDNSEILEIENKINSSSAGTAYFLKKKKDELIKDMLNKKINECGQESFELLKELSVEACVNKLLPKEVTERKEDMVLNSAFLVNKLEVDDFINMVDNLRMNYKGQGFSFDCTGPWPPYNFCRLPKEKTQSG